MHLVDKHQYPQNYFFAITREGIDGRRSLLQDKRGRHRRRSNPAASDQQSCKNQGQEPMATDEATEPAKDVAAAEPGQTNPKQQPRQANPEQQPDHEMEDLSSAMSSLWFVPMSVRFGRGGRAGFAKR